MKISRSKALLLGLLLFTALVTGACDLESHFLFFPDKELISNPGRIGLPYQDLLLSSSDGVDIHCWFIPGDKHLPVILFFHGNAGNISHRLENLRQVHDRLGASVLIIDYRGYGRSNGHASEQGFYRDARAAAAWLDGQGYEPQRRIYFGRSVGAAVALQLALEQPPAALVLESPFTSIKAMGRHHYPLLYSTLGWLIQAKFDNLSKISQLSAPLVIIHGRRDHIVPPTMARQLFDAAPEPKELTWLDQAGHNNTLFSDPPEYWAAWQELLERIDST